MNEPISNAEFCERSETALQQFCAGHWTLPMAAAYVYKDEQSEFYPRLQVTDAPSRLPG